MIAERLGKVGGWGVRKIGLKTLVSIILLMVILGTVSSGLNQVVRGLAIKISTVISLAGMLLGWALARSRLRGWQAGLCGACLGLGMALVLSGGLGSRFLLLVQELFALIPSALLWWRNGSPPDFYPLIVSLRDLGQNIFILLTQTMRWLTALFGGRPAYDPTAIAIVWGLALCWAGFWAAWAVRRWEQPLASALPAGALLATSLAYTRGPAIYLLPVLASAFLLIAWTNFGKQQITWQQSGVDYAEDIYFDLAPWTLFFAIGLTSLAIALSYISPQEILEFTNHLIATRSEDTEQVGESLGLELRSPETLGRGVTGGGDLPREHLLGAGPELTRELVMTVRIGEPAIDPEMVPGEQPEPQIYWRALTYDIYTGRGWATSETELGEYAANASLRTPFMLAHRLLRQEFRPLRDLAGRVFFAGQPVSVDRDYQVAYRTASGGDRDPFGLSLQDDQGVNSFRVDSLVPNVGEAQLREAGQGYPEWIAERYLQLPSGIPERVIELTNKITASASTAFDRASAIEDYLRTIPYTLDVPRPPTDQDVVDYFVFDLKAGYCDYYATSMVVMARAAGLPSRLVVGYAQGRYDAEQDRYVVSEAEAHSWVEIFFPGIGWVEFEPTGGRPALERPPDVPLPEIPEAEEIGGTQLTTQPAWSQWMIWAGALLAGGILIWTLVGIWHRRRMPAGGAITDIYRKLYRYGKKLGTPTNPGDTPNEFAAALTHQFGRSMAPQRWRETLELGGREARQIVDLYTRTIYSPHPAEIPTRNLAIQTWNRLRFRLWLARMLRFVGRIRHGGPGRW